MVFFIYNFPITVFKEQKLLWSMFSDLTKLVYKTTGIIKSICSKTIFLRSNELWSNSDDMFSVKGLRYNLRIYAASDIMKRTTPILLVGKLHIFASKVTVNFSKSMCIKISGFIFLNLSCTLSFKI